MSARESAARITPEPAPNDHAASAPRCCGEIMTLARGAGRDAVYRCIVCSRELVSADAATPARRSL